MPGGITGARNGEAEKGKNKANEDLSGLQHDYKKLCASAKYAGLGKSPSKWKVEIQEEKDKANHWEKRYRETSSRRLALEQELTKHRAENVNLRGHVIELEESLQEYRDQSSTVNEENELLRSQIDDMEAALQDCQGQIANFEEIRKCDDLHWQAKLERSQSQVEERDRSMIQAVAQVREVADHLQTLAVQADLLSLKLRLSPIGARN
ncbi:hypothetical protein GQ457_04G023920 [Hibiscus cannabinus]